VGPPWGGSGAGGGGGGGGGGGEGGGGARRGAGSSTSVRCGDPSSRGVLHSFYLQIWFNFIFVEVTAYSRNSFRMRLLRHPSHPERRTEPAG